MIIQNVYKAKAELSSLINAALAGKDVFISKAGEVKVKLIPVKNKLAVRKPGFWQGKVVIKKGFDKLPKELFLAFGEKP